MLRELQSLIASERDGKEALGIQVRGRGGREGEADKFGDSGEGKRRENEIGVKLGRDTMGPKGEREGEADKLK